MTDFRIQEINIHIGSASVQYGVSVVPSRHTVCKSLSGGGGRSVRPSPMTLLWLPVPGAWRGVGEGRADVGRGGCSMAGEGGSQRQTSQSTTGKSTWMHGWSNLMVPCGRRFFWMRLSFARLRPFFVTIVSS